MLAYLVVSIWIVADLFWWRACDRGARPLRGSWAWRLLLGGFMLAQLVYVAWLTVMGPETALPASWPMNWSIAAYLWHGMVLPVLCCIVLAVWAWRRMKQRRFRTAQTAPIELPSPSQITRRQVLGATAVALPPLATLALTRHAAGQLGHFQIRYVDLNVPGLPPDLDGLTIAHLSDVHLGRFMPLELAVPIARATNALNCDLIAFTGDLIDASSPSVDPGIEFMHMLRPRHEMVMIEGNHDVMFNAPRFEGQVKRAGLQLLLDEAMTFRIPGRATPVQVMGITWGDLLSGAMLHRTGKERNYLFREPSAAARAASVSRVAALRQAGAFPILLAHHPHAFDPAAAADLPLVLSGHTHGGQLMLTDHIGVGPLRFRYWSGVYCKPNSRLLVSNGVGSWFPLRVNAPAQIVRLTLRRQAAENESAPV